MSDDTEQRLRSVENAVMQMASSIQRMESYMEQLAGVVVRQEEHSKATERLFMVVEKTAQRTSAVERDIAKISGGLAVAQWLTGGSLVAVAGLALMLIGGR